ncbi:MAG TPA: hypothetical protein VK968_17640, partial [Roseimicrobium sp.]|nr:hypothetical protein [Roseimicrobium sp.]
NAFDLVWHRNGQLYAAANGGAAGGNTPAGSGVPSLMGVTQPESDFLFRIVKGGYYGHPNPKRGHFVLNGGNPTSGKDPYEVTDYPVGLKPDAAWRPAIYDFGIHQAPSGSMEYQGTAFGGALNGKLLVTRYSGGDDILVLTLNAYGGIAKAESGFPGMTGLADPVDLVEAPNSGNLYVIEMAKKRITLLRVDAPLATTASANVGQESPPSLVDAPPARTDPDTADVPTSPSRSEQRRLDLISALCSRMGSGSPSVELLRGKDLTSAFKTIKQLRTTAAAKGTLIPDLTGKSLFDLQELLRNVKALGNVKL